MRPRTSIEWLLVALAGLVALLAVAAAGLQMATERKRDAAVARVKRSGVVERYQKAHTPKAGRTTPTPPPNTSQTPIEGPMDSADPNDSIAAFARVFAAVQRLKGDKDWEQFEHCMLDKTPQERTDEDWARARRTMENSHDLILDIRRLAEMGGPAYVLDFSEGVALRLPHLSKLRDLARLLREDARVVGRLGAYGEAAADIMATFKLIRTVKDEPVLVSQLIRFAITKAACQAAQDALPPQGLSFDIAQMLVDYAANVTYRESFADSFSGEALSVLDLFQRLRNGDTSFFSPSPASLEVGLYLYGSAFARPLLNMDEATYAEITMRLGEIARLSFYEGKPKMDEIGRDIKNISWLRVMSYGTLRTLPHAIDAQAHNEANLGLLRVGLSLEQYHARNGKWPESLDALAPAFDGDVPKDPCSGHPFIYKPSGTSLLLYSIGTNGTDDGGRFDYSDGDIVWRGTPARAGD